MSDCQKIIPGYVEELKTHYKYVHRLNMSTPVGFLFVCPECQSTYSRFKDMKKHILKSHPEDCSSPARGKSPDQEEQQEAGPSGEPQAQFEQRDGPEYPTITNHLFFEPTVPRSVVLTKVREFVTGLRCDPSLPETKINGFMQASAAIIDDYQRYVLSLFKSFIKEKSLDLNDKTTIDFINNLEAKELFDEVKTLEGNLAYMAWLGGCAVSVPREEVLATRKVSRTIHLKPQRGRKMWVKKQIRTVKDTAHYIPIIETLTLVMQSPDARQMILTEPTNEEYVGSFKDGENFKEHEFLRKYPEAARISLHSDDVEYLNPLGSRKTKQKHTNISFKIENIHPAINASASRIYLALIVRSADVKR